MPEITAEQLAAQGNCYYGRDAEEVWNWTLTAAERDLIIAALREHEERAAEVRKPDPADPPEPIEFWWSNHNISEYYCANSKILAMVWWDAPGWWWRVDGDVATFEATLSAAKASVEKAVRNG